MADESDWIAAAITRARQQNPDGPEAIWTELQTLLKGKLSQKPVPAGELASVAMQLIEKMAVSQEIKEEK